MSNIGHLLQRFREHPSVAQLLQALNGAPAPDTAPPRVQIAGLKGAQTAFALAATVSGAHPAALFIAESKEEAAYLLNDLQGVLGESSAHFFPDSFKRPAFFDDLNPTQVLQRSEVVNRLSNPDPTPGPSPEGEGRSGVMVPSTSPLPFREGTGGGVVVTYPEALFEKVVSPEILAQKRIEIVRGENLDLDFVIEVLVEYGFERTDFVYEPGQFSLRGGIIDLFSYGNELPYRIELFDKEVESIRTFDPLTQLSSQQLNRLSIVPNLNTRFEREQKVSLLEVLPPGAVIWVRDFQFLLDRLQYCFEKAEQFAEKISALDAREVREIFRDRAFLFPREIIEAVREHPVVFLEKPSQAVTEMLS